MQICYRKATRQTSFLVWALPSAICTFECSAGPLLFWAKAQTRLSLCRSDGIKFDICDMSSVIVVIGSLLL